MQLKNIDKDTYKDSLLMTFGKVNSFTDKYIDVQKMFLRYWSRGPKNCFQRLKLVNPESVLYQTAVFINDGINAFAARYWSSSKRPITYRDSVRFRPLR